MGDTTDMGDTLLIWVILLIWVGDTVLVFGWWNANPRAVAA